MQYTDLNRCGPCLTADNNIGDRCAARSRRKLCEVTNDIGQINWEPLAVAVLK